jgi:hypothetical protein
MGKSFTPVKAAKLRSLVKDHGATFDHALKLLDLYERFEKTGEVESFTEGDSNYFRETILD